MSIRRRLAGTARTATVAAALAVTAALAPGTSTTGAAAAPRDLGRGVNILSTDGLFDRGNGSSFSFETLARLKALGFDHVRINALPFSHLSTEGILDERWIATLRRVIDAALARGLEVVVDVHEFGLCGRDARACETKLDATWRTLAERLSDYDDRVAFEILNEPGGALDAATWNRLQNKELKTIRRLNPRRRVVVTPIGGTLPLPAALARLELPDDDRDLVVTVHYYAPFAFTHQGAPWAGLGAATGIDWGSADDIAKLDRDFDVVAVWAKAVGRPVYVGEFGVYDRAEARPRFCWLYRVARAAERRGWSWAYWQLTSDFELMDERSGRWNDWVVAALTGLPDPAMCVPPRPGVIVPTPK